MNVYHYRVCIENTNHDNKRTSVDNCLTLGGGVVDIIDPISFIRSNSFRFHLKNENNQNSNQYFPRNIIVD